ncbi:adenosylcobinamide-GDP ribazoletransferase [Tepidibacillus fermentans]|uniref:Adenosylcobinamide-GDP ribazoletransferase n=1 Tax=Tepidibacillus fermentans TaxID=1281767 RepID=A0A4R3KAD7_9BACI|nr:adenosylcobinamide-GDP ribazoletransferase [Tepidibacillus fermentans]TCS79930.1 cobalamin-5'-phosphate synthase [Tepidibacillus fermentans]
MNEIDSFWMAIQYFSRIPVPYAIHYDQERMKRSILFLPAVGWIIGFFLFLFYQMTADLFPRNFHSILLVSFLLWITGGLHADGWMDVFDGIGSSRDKEKMLAIMKDSRVGAMGVIGFVILFALKTSSLNSINSNFFMEVLLVSPLLARFGVVLAVFLFPYARKEGLGRMLKEALTLKNFLFTLLWILPLFWLTSYGIYMFLLITGFVFLFGVYFTKKLGGLTGDVYGWLIEGGETVLWLMFVLLSR